MSLLLSVIHSVSKKYVGIFVSNPTLAVIGTSSTGSDIKDGDYRKPNATGPAFGQAGNTSHLFGTAYEAGRHAFS
jgi:hypothetical protein